MCRHSRIGSKCRLARRHYLNHYALSDRGRSITAREYVDSGLGVVLNGRASLGAECDGIRGGVPVPTITL